MDNTERIEAIRRFNRFYTRHIGVLDRGLLDTPFSLTEARVLYELAQREESTATDLGRELGIDAGYVARILQGFQRQGFIRRKQSTQDGRQKPLQLTPAGKKAFSRLNNASQKQIRSMLESIAEPEQKRLLESMHAIQQILDPGPECSDRSYVLRPHQPGDMGWVVERHGILYSREYGWDSKFEGLVAGIVARFLRDFDPSRERCWIAEKNGERIGSVFLVKRSEKVAQLRMLLVEPSARGLGIGKRLVQECTRFARQTGYRKILLWTNDVLTAARHLYEQEGYRLVKEERHHSFGHDLVGQIWELKISAES